MINWPTAITVVAVIIFVVICLAMTFPKRWEQLRFKRISKDGIETYPIAPPVNEPEDESEPRQDVVSKDAEASNLHTPLSRMFDAAAQKNSSAHEQAFNEAIASDDIDKEFITTLFHQQRIRMGIQSSVDKLKDLHSNNPSWVKPGVALAKYFSDTGQISKATETLQTCIDRSKTIPNPAAHTAMAELISTTQSPSDALEWCLNAIQQSQDSPTRSALMLKSARLAKSLDKKEDAILYADRSVRENPDNHDNRFQAAYLINELDPKSPLSLYHYGVLRRLVPATAFALNNFAAYFVGDTRLPYAELMLAASEHTKSWSFSNLAIFCAENGLFTAAEDYLAKAKSDNPNDKRVIDAADTIKQKREESDKILQKELEKSSVHDKFYSNANYTIGSTSKHQVDRLTSGEWHDEESQVTLILEASDESETNKVKFFRKDKSFDGTISLSQKISTLTLKEVKAANEKVTVLSYASPEVLNAKLVMRDKDTILILCHSDRTNSPVLYSLQIRQPEGSKMAASSTQI